jgi:hypothetical protein
MNAEDLNEEYGRTIKPSELAKFLDIDTRTVKKYYHLWGGVPISPTDYRFFENKVKEAINANINNETWKEAMERCRNGEPEKHRKTISGPFKTESPGCHSMGNHNSKRTEIPSGSVEHLIDTHGVFDC